MLVSEGGVPQYIFGGDSCRAATTGASVANRDVCGWSRKAAAGALGLRFRGGKSGPVQRDARARLGSWKTLHIHSSTHDGTKSDAEEKGNKHHEDLNQCMLLFSLRKHVLKVDPELHAHTCPCVVSTAIGLLTENPSRQIKAE